jgi:ssDNA-binding Zn-finger/Zn-ribbon topoisomerase 1
MDTPATRVELACGACGRGASLGPEDLLDWLRGRGMLRRAARPAREEVLELARSAAAAAPCESCGAVGLLLRLAAEDEGGWPQARRCAGCGGLIPPERQEALPDAELCAACQQRADQGHAPPATDYCPRCGAPMEVRPTRSAGLARYRLVCSRWPECRGTG